MARPESTYKTIRPSEVLSDKERIFSRFLNPQYEVKAKVTMR